MHVNDLWLILNYWNRSKSLILSILIILIEIKKINKESLLHIIISRLQEFHKIKFWGRKTNKDEVLLGFDEEQK